MITALLEPFQFSFMTSALLAALLVAIPCALLSVFLVLKGWALMGDAMSHAVFPGVVLAWMLSIPLGAGAFVAGLFCALATGFLKDNSRIKQDTVMGIVFSGMFAAGLILYIALKPEVHLDHILFGDMLGITFTDMQQTMVISAVVAVVIAVKWRDFLLFCFDIQQARACGLRTGWLHYGLLCMVSLTIVATLKSVGIILSISLLIAPGAISVLLTRRFHQALLIAVAISIIISMAGVYLSFYIDSAPAPTIVVLFAGVFVVTFIFSSLSVRRRERQRLISDQTDPRYQ
ncbi:manganese/iron transport system permease protein [Izhakiella capsodis]|uniref:Manganese/iron transport system permease protein n=1 Tax=Izhakiella capsodis TaxID=1367852 RepID=A0A1I4V8K9_9GAMM|nr:metal ABC transporter permease [Izhakiella capsodis]SFM97495.1 manganese/iron transport system permease protein [Izhakiella capsodis]